MNSFGSQVAAVSASRQKKKKFISIHVRFRIKEVGKEVDERMDRDRDELTSHMRKLLASALQVIAVLGLDGILDSTGDRIVGAENLALDELDLPGLSTLETAGHLGGWAAWSLPLPPCFGGAGLAPLVGRFGTLMGTEGARRVIDS